MAKKEEVKIIKVVGNSILVQEEDGSKALYAKVDVDVEDLVEAAADEEDEEDEDDAPTTYAELQEMDYDDLSELVDDQELEDIDVEDYDEDEEKEVEKLRQEIAKAMDIEIPKKGGKKGKK